MRCNNINSINKEAPITCKIRINQPITKPKDRN